MNFYEQEPVSSIPEKAKDKPEEILEKLGWMMADVAKNVNQEFGEEVLNSDASINMRQWKRSADFPAGYRKEDIKTDEDLVFQKKVLYSGSGAIRGERNVTDSVAAWEKRREASKPALLELATTAIFHKILGEKYMVVRSSTFDDYENGVDNIIVNKETGNVVCAFDEVREFVSGHEFAQRKDEDGAMPEKSRLEKKEDKIIYKAKKGGTKIKYGFGLSGGKLVKKQITGVPMFFISLNTEELDKLLQGMDCDSETPNAAELEIFDKLILSLSEQVKMLKQEKIDSAVAKNLANFEKSLVEIEELRKKF